MTLAADVHLRPFTDADYEAVANLQNASTPDYATTAQQMREGDGRRDPKCKWSRSVAERDSTVIGVADWSHMMWMFHPQKFWVGITVHPEHRCLGVGNALYQRIQSELEPFDPVAFRTGVREDWTHSMTFAGKRGFVEEMRHWESHLDVPGFDPARFAEDTAKFAEGKIAVRSYAELASDPTTNPRLYELTEMLGQDVPSPDGHTPIEYEQWLKFLEGPNFLPEATFVAVDTANEDRFVGFSNLFSSQADDHLHTGLTGVSREYRRQGIALAMKLRAVEYARKIGAPVIRTSNETNNRGMLSINETLGFAKQPVWINLVNHLKEEDK